MGEMSNENDKVNTPTHIAKEVMDIFTSRISQGAEILEPFRGGGAFYDLFPVGKRYWCEIDEERCFLQYQKKHDWIITNPPYSSFKLMLPKMLDTACHVVLVIPVNKLLSSMPRLMDIRNKGFNICHIHYLGSGRQIKFPFGFPVGAVYLQKGYLEDVKVTYADRCYHAKGK